MKKRRCLPRSVAESGGDERMRVPFMNLRRHGAAHDEALTRAFVRVLESGHYVLGEEVSRFERRCADLLGAEHAIGVSSGTDALLVTLMSLGVGPGDEVIVPAFTFFATAGAVARVGATPVFADVCPRCLNVDPSSVAERVSARTRAAIAVDLFGALADYEGLGRVTEAAGIALVEDAAQAFGVTGVGARSLAACFSFFPTKNLGALGDAGLVATSSHDLADRIRVLRSQGARPKYHHVAVGGNFRLDALQAALLDAKLTGFPEARAARRGNARRYDELFAATGLAGRPDSPIALPRACHGEAADHQYCIRASQRDELRAFLEAASVGTEIYYPEPLHHAPCFAHLSKQSLPVAERASREILALPMFPGLTEEEIAYVVESVARFFGR